MFHCRTLYRPLCLVPLLLGTLFAPLAAQAQQGAALAKDVAAALEAAAAWQNCPGKDDAAERLACFDHWAREQQALLDAVQEKNRSVAESPNSSAADVSMRQEVSAALAAIQPAAADDSAITGSAGILGVGLEQGCRDRQFSPLSRFWELESGSSCPTFGLRAFQPTTVSLTSSNRANTLPTSANPVNNATAPVDYDSSEARIAISVRTKLAGGLLTPAGSTLRDSLWIAYTAQSYWQIFNGALSRPFRNTDHMPEIMYVYPTTAQLPGGWLWRYSGVGLAHQSNGQSDPLSRSWNRAYLMTGIEKDNRFSLKLRLWKRFGESAEKDNNPDITRFVGRGDLTFEWHINSRNGLRATYTGLNRRGSGRIEWTHALGEGYGNTFSGLRLYTWLFHGYGDSLLDYNFRRTVFGLGLSLVDF
ncbi:MAG: phospholipase A [Burkholderiaceae bacterium]|jgi:phospholipase A1|nr:phospholipase A [Burkholderiaceae bacterium]